MSDFLRDIMVRVIILALIPVTVGFIAICAMLFILGILAVMAACVAVGVDPVTDWMLERGNRNSQK